MVIIALIEINTVCGKLGLKACWQVVHRLILTCKLTRSIQGHKLLLQPYMRMIKNRFTMNSDTKNTFSFPNVFNTKNIVIHGRTIVMLALFSHKAKQLFDLRDEVEQALNKSIRVANHYKFINRHH